MFRNILVPVDLENPKECAPALALAAELAALGSGKVTICTVVRDSAILAQGDWLPLSYEQQLVEARWKLEKMSTELESKTPVDVEIGAGTISGGILDVAKRIAADLIVLASHKPGAGDYFHAANAARVARRAHCSVLIVRPGSRIPQRRNRRMVPKKTGAKD